MLEVSEAVKVRGGSRIGQREKLTYDVLAMEAAAEATECSGAGMILP